MRKSNWTNSPLSEVKNADGGFRRCNIYYEKPGAGDAVLLCPPSWWPCDTWNVGVVPFLSKKFRTIIFDCRGTGHSSKPDHGYTIEQFAKDCAGLLEHLKIARCHAAGFALGRPDRPGVGDPAA